MASDVPVLKGVRVVEMTMWVAGPSAGGILADWGADVVKVEPPSGDPQRNVFKLTGYPEGLPNPPFALDNRGKRSVILDLRSESGRAAMEKLLADADVFLSNMRQAKLAKLGLGHEQVSTRHPKLVYATISGYGLDGPDADRPGYDIGAFWARSGIARDLVPKDSEPVPVRSGLGDHVTGMSTVSGILAALLERGRTGKGRVVEVSLLRTGMWTIGGDIGIQATFGKLESTKPRERCPLPLFNSYKAGDDKWFWLLGVEADRHFPGLMRAIDREELLDDSRFNEAKARRRHAEEFIAELDTVFGTRPLEDWTQRFDREDVWWAPCQSVAEVMDDSQIQAAGGFVDIPESSASIAMKSVATPVTFRGDPLKTTGPVPDLGEHTAEVLRELGMSDDEIEAL